jgi:hypothetical protein
MRDSKTTRFTHTIRLTPEDYFWIQDNKGKKSAAGYLEELIRLAKDSSEVKNGDLEASEDVGSDCCKGPDKAH